MPARRQVPQHPSQLPLDETLRAKPVAQDDPNAGNQWVRPRSSHLDDGPDGIQWPSEGNSACRSRRGLALVRLQPPRPAAGEGCALAPPTSDSQSAPSGPARDAASARPASPPCLRLRLRALRRRSSPSRPLPRPFSPTRRASSKSSSEAECSAWATLRDVPGGHCARSAPRGKPQAHRVH